MSGERYTITWGYYGDSRAMKFPSGTYEDEAIAMARGLRDYFVWKKYSFVNLTKSEQLTHVTEVEF